MAALRGYASWNPKPETLAWVQRVQKILRAYHAYLPMPIRQVFYRLVQEYDFEKSEQAYGRLVTWIARARRAQLLSFDSFRDAQGRPNSVLQYAGEEGFWEDAWDNWEHFRRDRMQGQPVRIEVWSESMVDQLTRVAWRYGIPVYSSRGYTSVTNARDVAMRALAAKVPTVILHVGDHDPSGEGIFNSLAEDALAFLIQERWWEEPETRSEDGTYRINPETGHFKEGADLRAVRVLLTPEQIEKYEVETAPPKSTDSRSKTWVGETAQAEALPPDLIAEILQEAIEDQLDMEEYQRQVEMEEADKEAIREKLPEV